MARAEAEGKGCLPRNSNLANVAYSGKLDQDSLMQPQQLPNQPQLRCPECGAGAARLYKDGLRRTVYGDVQRYLCRDCGYRFSHSPSTRNGFKGLKAQGAYTNTCQVCDDQTRKRAPGTRQVLELATAQPEKENPTREGTGQLTDQATTKGLIVQFAAWLEREGYEDCYLRFIKLLARRGANLTDPESVKTIIAKQPWNDSSRMLASYSYDAFARMLKIEWEPPKYTQQETIPFVPEESELDALIAACKSKRMAAFLQCLKETYADPGEILKLEWTDINGNIITINHPVKNHLPGQLQVSQRLLSMLNNLPKISTYVFPTRYASMNDCFKMVRARAAQTLQNPRLLKISFTTFHHWGGTMIAHYTRGNILTVKRLLRHKNVNNTMKYIGMIHFKDDEFEVTTATTVDEAKTILAAGFDYITEKNGIMLFRRPKRFKSLL